MKRLAILASGRGTHLPVVYAATVSSVIASAAKQSRADLDCFAALAMTGVKDQLAAQIALVVSNKEQAPVLTKAAELQLPSQYLNPARLTREQYDAQLSALLTQHQIDLVVLMGYMRILSAPFVNQWQNKIINVHPSLLPAFSGLMDLAVHQAVIDAGVKETGCTVHFVTEEVDAGPIVVQKTCPVLTDDTKDSLKARVQALEGQALIEAIAKLGSNYVIPAKAGIHPAGST